jgi:cytidyltransferase-like protein
MLSVYCEEMKKIMVFGTFDRLHKGHIHFFKQARKYGDFLIAVVARDKNVKIIKGKLPRDQEKIRLSNVKKFADKAILGSLKKGYDHINKLKPDRICLGYDQEADLKKLKEFKIPIKRLKSHKPHKYKSSLM